MAIKPDLLGTGAAAKALDVSPDRVRQLARDGELAYVAVDGGRRLFQRKVIEDLALRRALKKYARHGGNRGC